MTDNLEKSRDVRRNWEKNPEIVVKKWKLRALQVLFLDSREQLAHGCFDEDNFNDLVCCLIFAKSKKDYVQNYWNLMEELKNVNNKYYNCLIIRNAYKEKIRITKGKIIE